MQRNSLQMGDYVWTPGRKKGHIIEINSDDYGKYARVELDGITGVFVYDLEELVRCKNAPSIGNKLILTARRKNRYGLID